MHIGLKLNQEIHVKDRGSKTKPTLKNIAVTYKYQINIRCGFDNMHDILCCDICNSDISMCDIYAELKLVYIVLLAINLLLMYVQSWAGHINRLKDDRWT